MNATYCKGRVSTDGASEAKDEICPIHMMFNIMEYDKNMSEITGKLIKE